MTTLPSDVFEVRDGVNRATGEPTDLAAGWWHFARYQTHGPFASRRAAQAAFDVILRRDLETVMGTLEREGVIRRTGTFRDGKPEYTRTGKPWPDERA